MSYIPCMVFGSENIFLLGAFYCPGRNKCNKTLSVYFNYLNNHKNRLGT